MTPIKTKYFGLKYKPTLNSELFDCGIASGDPTDSGVILWTRVNPNYLDFISSVYLHIWKKGNHDNRTTYEICSSEVVESRDYTIKLDLDGHLESDLFYYYQFEYKEFVSEVGRCRTLPSQVAKVNQARLAFVTCQDFTTGYYSAFKHLAKEEIDYVIHLGDFIYEYDRYEGFEDRVIPGRELVFPSGETRATSLDDYRYAYKKYRSDINLQQAMASHTWIITTDDHDCADNCFWDYDLDTLGLPPHDYRASWSAEKRREIKVNSMKAWYDYTPTRVTLDLTAEHPHQMMRIYRSFPFGNLFEIFMTDSRSYRNGPLENRLALSKEKLDEFNAKRSMLGKEQKEWLIQGIENSDALWKIWGNQTLLAELVFNFFVDEIPINTDAWDGFFFEREQISKAFKEANVERLLTITGDMHSSLASYNKVIYESDGVIYPNGDLENIIGVEFMTPSISSPNLIDNIRNKLDKVERSSGKNITDEMIEWLIWIGNPHVQYFKSSIYGYSILSLNESMARWDVFSIDKEASEATLKNKIVEITYDPEKVKLSVEDKLLN